MKKKKRKLVNIDLELSSDTIEFLEFISKETGFDVGTVLEWLVMDYVVRTNERVQVFLKRGANAMKEES